MISGFIAHILAVSLIFIGLQMPKLGRRTCSTSLYSGLFLFGLVYYAATEIALEVIDYMLLIKKKGVC